MAELLAPAGGMEQLKAAVRCGADGVYLGGQGFNARINANNFADEELTDAVRFCHVRGVKVYLTLNTLVKEQEMPLAVAQAEKAAAAGVDAFIIQDLGLGRVLRLRFPDVPVHLSTQGTVYSPEGVNLAAELGYSRVILARETPLQEIRKIKGGSSVELEVFVHGALCVCYSGQCHLSSIIGGRSGNRGQCAQPCRLPWKLLKDGRETDAVRYPLSPKDQCLAGRLGDLLDAGVASLKIEGRMKSPEYVGAVTSVYRKYLDMYAEDRKCPEEVRFESGMRKGRAADPAGSNYDVSEQDNRILLQTFNRGAFSQGYLEGLSGPQLMSGDVSKHVGVAVGRIKSVNSKNKTVEILLTDELNQGDGIEIEGSYGERPGNVVTYLARRECFSIADGSGTSRTGTRIGTGDRGNVKNASVTAASKKKSQHDPGGKKGRTREKITQITSACAGETVLAGDIDCKGSVRPGDRVYRITDKKLMDKIGGKYACEVPLVGVDMSFKSHVGEAAELILSDKKGRSVSVCSGRVMEKAEKRPADKERIAAQLGKLGGTPYRMDILSTDIDDDVMIPLSVINDMRRRALEKLSELRAVPEREVPVRAVPESTDSAAIVPAGNVSAGVFKTCETLVDEAAYSEDRAYWQRPEEDRNHGQITGEDRAYRQTPEEDRNHGQITGEDRAYRQTTISEIQTPGLPGKYTLYYYTVPEELPENMMDCHRIYMPWTFTEDEKLLAQCEEAIKAGHEIYAALPVITLGECGENIKNSRDRLASLFNTGKISGLSVSTLNELKLFAGAGIPIHADEGMNVFNSRTMDVLASLGVTSLSISPELSREEAEAAAGSSPAGICPEYHCRGSRRLMITEHCIIGCSGRDDKSCCSADLKQYHCRRGQYTLKDRKGKEYALAADSRYCRSEILSIDDVDPKKAAELASAAGFKRMMPRICIR